MKIILDSTKKSLQIKLGGSVATSQLPYTASWVDINQSSFAIVGVGSSDGTTNNTTAVTVISSPASGVTRQVKSLTVQNADTTSETLTLQYNDAGIVRTIVSIALDIGDQLIVTD